MTIKEVLQRDAQFRYMLLGRLSSDCESCLNREISHGTRLWAGNPKDQIKYMRAILDSFPDTEKPVWCTKEMIDRYELLLV